MAIRSPFPPMEARTAKEIPTGKAWWYEPKWDGFRCLAFKRGDEVELQSKASKPLTRYFPELVERLRAVPERELVLDGEIVVFEGDGLSFDALLQRIHPAGSRVQRLARETPASFIVFDVLSDRPGGDLTSLPLAERRKHLDELAVRSFRNSARRGSHLYVSPVAKDLRTAKAWLDRSGPALDGLMAKQRDEPYRSGERAGMVKIKFKRTADCVVGGFRYGTGIREVGSLLLGLHDEEGLLNHVGFCTTLHFADRAALTKKLEKLGASPGFTGASPGGPSRWASERSTQWEPVAPKLVVEVEFDHFTGDRFRHGTKFLRWRPDKAPRQCTIRQVQREAGAALRLLRGKRAGGKSGR